jgi:hypothetical protein
MGDGPAVVVVSPDGARIGDIDIDSLKVATRPQGIPAGTTEFVLAQDDVDLEVGPTPSYDETESAVIDNGHTLYLQSISSGAAGDPSEKGSKVEVYWREGAGPTDHLIDRLYVIGSSIQIQLPATSKARDGTDFVGDGSTTKVVIRRERLSTSAQEIDAVVRGYTEAP